MIYNDIISTMCVSSKILQQSISSLRHVRRIPALNGAASPPALASCSAHGNHLGVSWNGGTVPQIIQMKLE